MSEENGAVVSSENRFVQFLKKNFLHIVYCSVILALAVTVTLLAVALARADDDSGLSDHIKYYNAKCESYVAQNFNLSRGQIVFIGDSITDLCPLDDYYADLDLACYNRGIGGDTTSGVLARLEVSVFDLAPSKVVLLIGTNDINGNVENEKILENYGRILSEIRTKLPDTEIYMMSVIPQNEDLETYSEIKVAETTERILSLNVELRKLAVNDEKIHYFDLFSLLADENNRLKKQYSDDGIHLNAGGFEVWSGLIKPHLK